MATFEVNALGEVDDRVRLVVDGKDVLIAESYDVTVSVFNQPARWSITTGSASTAAELIKTFAPGRPFELRIGDVLQQTGVLEDRAARSRGGTTLTLTGRDALVPLFKDHISDERSYKSETYVQLAYEMLKAVGLKDATIQSSNRANRQVRAGVKIVELLPPREVLQIKTDATGVSGVSHNSIEAKLNEKRYEFLKRYLQVAGLFFWAAADGTFVISEPNGHQQAVASIVRRVGQSRQQTSVIADSWQDNRSNRYRTYSVYGRGAGRKGGHQKAMGVWIDPEMRDDGFTESKVVRAQNARTAAQAEFIARRMAAEDRRSGWQLRYTVSGHTTVTASGERAVWTPDTVVSVDDEVLGIKRDLYLSEVTYRRAPETTTDLVFTRPEDLVFGDGDGVM